jgi:hypothetical protein
VHIRNIVVCDVTPCILVEIYRSFAKSCWLYLHRYSTQEALILSDTVFTKARHAPYSQPHQHSQHCHIPLLQVIFYIMAFRSVAVQRPLLSDGSVKKTTVVKQWLSSDHVFIQTEANVTEERGFPRGPCRCYKPDKPRIQLVHIDVALFPETHLKPYARFFIPNYLLSD